jgi:ATP-dependent Lon protease
MVNVSRLAQASFARATGSATQPPDTSGSLTAKDYSMRDFRDAKAMAQTLRQSLSARSVAISHSESLELVSKMFGTSDWNTLSAHIRNGRDAPATTSPITGISRSCPAIPLRDFVPFPHGTFPLFVARDKTRQALDRAFAGEREVALAIQKDQTVDDPGHDDLYEIGVLAEVLELEPAGEGKLRGVARATRRIAIRKFHNDADGYSAEIASFDQAPAEAPPELVRQTIDHFKTYAATRGMRLPELWVKLEQTSDAGRIADMIGMRLMLSVPDKQALIATLDPLARLQKVDAALRAETTALREDI